MDQFTALRAFTAVIETGSFAAAARRLGIATSSVTRQVDALEAKLGARLFNRSTRTVTPTSAGSGYYEHAARILSDLEEADRAVARLDESPRGPLRVSAPVAFGRMHVAPMVAGYLARYPAVELYLNLSDALVNLVEDNVDVAIRVADLQDSPSLIARRIAPHRRVLCASPDYLAAHGEPQTPVDLAQHNCLCYAQGPGRIFWRFKDEHGTQDEEVRGTLRSNNAETLVEAAIRGAGVVVLPTWLVGEHLRAGRLRPILTRYRYGRPGQHFAVADIFAVYLPNRSGSPKVKSFIDALIEHIGRKPYWDADLTLRETQ
jgi:DNA-binding transcriptional LysR family regulator